MALSVTNERSPGVPLMSASDVGEHDAAQREATPRRGSAKPTAPEPVRAVASAPQTQAQRASAPLSPAAPSVSVDRKPEAITPPFPASAKPGDGEWRPYGGETTAGSGFWRTELHPHRTSPFVTVTVVAIDLSRNTLDWVVGTADQGADQLVGHQRPGLATPGALAVFNGGFQARHGHWGQVSHGVTLVPPKPDGCGVAIDAAGEVELGPPSALANDLVSYRQTPPCLVVDGALNPGLLSGRDAAWAGKSEHDKTRRRSALGLRRAAKTLFYLVGVEAEAVDLGRALVALGVDVGLQLDINWNWTRFFLVGQNDDSPAVHSPLLEGMVMDVGEYVRRPSKRDFFVVRARKQD